MPPTAVPVPAEPGDVLVHDVRIEHGSPVSESETGRRAIVVEYFDAAQLAGRDDELAPLW